jgi:WXXGXW repeat (2 copies)
VTFAINRPRGRNKTAAERRQHGCHHARQPNALPANKESNMSNDWSSNPHPTRLLALIGLAAAAAVVTSGCVVREPRSYPAPVIAPTSDIEAPAGPMPPPITETRPAPPSASGWSWVPGHWEWGVHRWHWHRGHWINEVVPVVPADVSEVPPPAPSPAHIWIRGHWRWAGHGWVWVAGAWVR